MANPLHRVLIVDPNRSLPEHRPRTRAERGRTIVTDTVTTVTEAVRRLQQAGYDAVLVKVSRPEEISLVLRIRTEVPEARVLAVTSEGIQLGSDGATQTEELLRRCRDAVHHGHQLMDRLRESEAERKRLEASVLASGVPLEKLIPLVVDSDDRHALPLRHAFEKLGFAFPHPVARSSKEAVACLGANPSPNPTLFLVALQTPKGPTYEFLSWIRSRDALMNLPVFVMGSSFSPATRQQVIEAGADAYFSRPTFPGEHEELVRLAAVKWATLFGIRFGSARRT